MQSFDQLRMKSVTAFDGAVTFVFVSYTAAQQSIAFSELRESLPDAFESAGEKDMFRVRNTPLGRRVTDFLWLIGRTADVVFNLQPDASDELVAFQTWWSSVGLADYLTLFKTFRILGRDVVTAWENARQSVTEKQAVGALPLQPGAEAAAAGDPNFPAPDAE